MREKAKRLVAILWLVALFVVCAGTPGHGFVNLQVGDHPLYWADPLVQFVIHETADPTINDTSDETAIREAFQTWERIPTSAIRFNEDASTQSRSRTDWRSDDVHLVMWDHTNESGFFDDASGLVSVTPVDFNPSTGELLDADILVNGKKRFSTDLTAGTYDIRAVITHEVGHFIGLDHSGIQGTTMGPVPLVNDTRMRSLELDDIAGASTLYPAAAHLTGRIEGYVRHNNAPVSGAHVVAENQDGAPASSSLTDANGRFVIRGLNPGDYVVYAEPLDGPLRAENLSLHSSGLRIDTGFGTTFWGNQSGRSSPANPDQVQVTAGGVTALGALSALPSTRLNATSAGQNTVAPGGQIRMSVRGSWIYNAKTILIPGSPGESLVVSAPQFGYDAVRFDLFVPSHAQPRLVNVRLFDPDTWECTVLSGGFEIRLAAPQIASVSSRDGAPGDSIVVDGTNFQPGARAVLDSAIVPVAGSGGQVSFTIPQLPNGTYSIAIENPDGQFAKVKQALTVRGSAATQPPAPATTTNNTQGSGGARTPQPTPNPTTSGSTASGSGSSGGGGGCTLGDTGSGGAPFAPIGLLGLLLLLARLRRDAA